MANSANSLSYNPSTGGCDSLVIQSDSVLISYDDLRLVNSKLIELEYERQINDNLRTIIVNDSIIIREYKTINNKINKDYKKAIQQRNIGVGTGVVFFIVSLFLLLK